MMNHSNKLSAKVTRVGVFGLYYPNYRLGVFRKLANLPDVSFTFHGAQNVSGSFLKTEHENPGFPFVDIWTKRIKLPFLNNYITFQPYAVWCMLMGEFDVFIMACDILRPSVWCNLVLSHILGRKVCLWGHGKSYPPSRIAWFLRSIMFRLAHSVIFYTDGVRQEWMDDEIHKEKLFVAYNALDTDISNAIISKTTETELKKFRCEHGIEGKDIILFCGRLFLEWKKPHILIKAMKQVIVQKPNVHLVIIGDGPDRKFLEELIESLQLSYHVTLTGAIHDEELIGKFMLISKLAVIPGNAGLGIQHAFGYGVPFITNSNLSKQTPEIELLVDNVNGRLCKDEDVSDFARAIIDLLTNENKRQAMAENAFQVIEKKYNVDNMAKGIIDAVKWAAKQEG